MTDSQPSLPTSSPWRGRLLILTAAVMWSTSGFFAKSPLFDNWDPASRGALLAFWRAVFASLVLLPMVRRPRWNWYMLPMVICFVAMNVTFLSAVVLTTAANAIWLQHTAPAWVFLAGAVWLNERLTAADWRLLFFAALGVGTILFFESRGESMLGVVCGLLGGLTYAGVVLSIRHLRGEDAAWLVAINHVATAVALAPLAFLREAWPVGEQWPMLIGFGVFQMGIPYLLFARGLRVVPGHEATALNLLEPLLVPLWVWIAWRDTATYQAPQWWTYVGGGLILIGLLIRFLPMPRWPAGWRRAD